MRNISALLLIFILGQDVFGQADTLYTLSGYLKISNNPDSVEYSKDYYFNEGLYRSYADFRTGNAIPRALILTSIEKNQLDFYGKLLEKNDTLIFRFGEGIQLVLKDSVFCFVQNNTLYVNVNGSFFRVPVFGRISHFFGTITIESFQRQDILHPSYITNSVSSITGAPVRTKENRQFLFGFYDGKILLANPENMIDLMKNDKELCKEFTSLTKNQQRKKMNLFIKKYNFRNKVYFPKA